MNTSTMLRIIQYIQRKYSSHQLPIILLFILFLKRSYIFIDLSCPFPEYIFEFRLHYLVVFIHAKLLYYFNYRLLSVSKSLQNPNFFLFIQTFITHRLTLAFSKLIQKQRVLSLYSFIIRLTNIHLLQLSII